MGSTWIRLRKRDGENAEYERFTKEEETRTASAKQRQRAVKSREK